MNYKFREYRDRDNKQRLAVVGVSFGYGDSSPYLIEKNGDYMIVRCPAGKDWSGRGQTSFYNARMEVWKVIGQENNLTVADNIWEQDYYCAHRDGLIRREALALARKYINIHKPK